MTSALKLYATAEEDIAVISALFQDAALKVSDIAWLSEEKRFVLLANRFVWEKKRWFKKPKGERIRAAVHFNTVLKAQFQGIDLADKNAVLSLLAIEAKSDECIQLTFSGGAAIRLTVECIDAAASDLSEAWDALARPDHDHI
ncbi:DUF2948 family protein [Kordiimonas sp. SCSIO 12610]|uniref:DUF2948 family protein n=1 Tax=Kordiimonas sp. SCSIO 12610 TaxID=2829597 RepID=UPI00210A6BB8|nr:DUF2948 family protein [Kordiimonas sp. SCSIO 12610]UTW55684.1 DUF2948 family protein [Kordiimonas sp. SCSIO 12610]